MRCYSTVKVLGEGGFGTAILARNRANGSLVVIKKVSLSQLKASDRESAIQEARVLHSLHSPFIISYITSFQENDTLNIVMDYADGGDLSSKIDGRRGVLFTEDEILHYFIQIVLALKYIHDRHILHRDLKTQNVFLTKSGKVLLGDFGIARVLEDTLQMCRTQIGTPHYLSPEICEGRVYNSKTDIWSLGCILYELCTLRRPFDAGNLNHLIIQIIRGRQPPITGAFSPQLRSLVDLLLAKDPARRPSAREILAMPIIRARRSAGSAIAQLYRQQRREAMRNRERFEAAAKGIDVRQFMAEVGGDPRRRRRGRTQVEGGSESLMYRAEEIRARLERECEGEFGALIRTYAEIAEDAEVRRVPQNIEPRIVALLQQLVILDERIARQ
jgi:NIMA (never in mitosis gene a)-related kinase